MWAPTSVSAAAPASSWGSGGKAAAWRSTGAAACTATILRGRESAARLRSRLLQGGGQGWEAGRGAVEVM